MTSGQLSLSYETSSRCPVYRCFTPITLNNQMSRKKSSYVSDFHALLSFWNIWVYWSIWSSIPTNNKICSRSHSLIFTVWVRLEFSSFGFPPLFYPWSSSFVIMMLVFASSLPYVHSTVCLDFCSYILLLFHTIPDSDLMNCDIICELRITVDII